MQVKEKNILPFFKASLLAALFLFMVKLATGNFFYLQEAAFAVGETSHKPERKMERQLLLFYSFGNVYFVGFIYIVLFPGKGTFYGQV